MKSDTLLRLKRLIASNYRKVMIIFFIFLAMILVSYSYTSFIVRRQMQEINEETMDMVQMSFSACMHEAEPLFMGTKGTNSAAFIRPVFSGWYIGVVIASFYSQVHQMGIVLGSLGVILLLAVSAMLVWGRTLQMRTAKALSDQSASLNVLKAVLNAMDIFIHVTNTETEEILFANDKFKTHFNLDDSIIGKCCWQIFREGRCESCPKEWLTANPGDPFTWEEYKAVSGRFYRTTARIIDWPDGKKVIFHYRVDINDEKQARDRLLMMSSIVENSPNFISYRKAAGECVFMNKAATELTGYSCDELMEDYIGTIYDKETSDYIKSVIIPELLEKGMMNYELPFIRKDGLQKYCTVTSFKIESDNNAIASIAMDVTDKRQAEAEKLAALEKAEQASRVKGDFLSRMSHEMRTPMTAVIGMCTIAQKAKDQAEVQECLKTIGDSADHLLGIINDILDMSKIEAGAVELKTSEIQFQDILDQVNAVMKIKLDDKRQNFTVKIDNNVPTSFITDRQKLAQVIINLMSNANKFTPEDGNISLSVHMTEDLGNQHKLIIEVKDNGIGIPEEQQARIFNVFEQLDNTITRQFGGTGLGLTVAKKLVNMMNGEIWVRSRSGEGAEFCFTIVVDAACAAESNRQDTNIADEDSIANIFCGKHILLADDVEINRDILAALLEDTGVIIDCAENGREVCGKFAANPEVYDLIFMDIHMPEMDGYEATGSIREMENARARTVPIIAMTADVFSEDIQKCLASGMNDHIGKPLNMDTVIYKMKMYLL